MVGPKLLLPQPASVHRPKSTLWVLPAAIAVKVPRETAFVSWPLFPRTRERAIGTNPESVLVPCGDCLEHPRWNVCLAWVFSRPSSKRAISWRPKLKLLLAPMSVNVPLGS